MSSESEDSEMSEEEEIFVHKFSNKEIVRLIGAVIANGYNWVKIAKDCFDNSKTID